MGFLSTSTDPIELSSLRLNFEHNKKFEKPKGVDESNWHQQSVATKIKYAQWEDPIYGNIVNKIENGTLAARVMMDKTGSFASDPYMMYTSQYLSKKIPEWVGSIGSSSIWGRLANYFSSTKNPYHPR